MNLLEIYNLPQSKESEVAFKKEAYKYLLEEALENEDYDLAIVCRDSITELKHINFKEVDCKKCSKCLQVKPLEDFHANKKSKDKKSNYCKLCKKIINFNYWRS